MKIQNKHVGVFFIKKLQKSFCFYLLDRSRLKTLHLKHRFQKFAGYGVIVDYEYFKIVHEISVAEAKGAVGRDIGRCRKI